MNLTLSIDEKLLRRARQLAERRGTSVNQMVRDYLTELTSDHEPGEVVAALERLWDESGGDSRGWPWDRDEIHDRSQLR